MDNEWKELDIANLPPDILVGDYEFVHTDKHITCTSFATVEILRNGLNGHKYYYRKRAPKEPTHEEIRKNHIKSVKDSIMFSENGFRDTIIDAILFILKSSGTPQEEKS